MIENEEEQIKLIQEIDNTFTEINKALSETNTKLTTILKENKKISEDLKPYKNFFSIKQNTNESILIDFNDHTILNSTIADNRIEDKSNILNDSDSTYKKIHTPSFTHSNSSINIESFKNEYSIAEESLLSFDINILPDIFKKEKDLEILYNFIKNNKKVTKEEIIERFSDVENEKIKIFIDVLIRKNFIRKKNEYYEI
ncbi:hypothetical protein SLOPH_1848 [Spraguea lophii 42_110]|uniref:Uncharacterized protein n=1 Tax=Spraguea lophii (strain 42_110) TaxID=1358809 RepID=S7XKK6_SPRLO|nr:hypothetical protein SLOPH_1848 [Spraguea lophii 42_110]